jgi:hypothetical protein
VNSNVSAWTFGGSILSFAFPMILFIVVAGALYVLYTKPEFVPGHPAPRLERPVSYTPVPGQPAAERSVPASLAAERAQTPQTVQTAGTTTAETGQTAEVAEPDGPSGTSASQAAGTEDAE